MLFSTYLGPLPLPTAELDYNLGTAGESPLQGLQVDMQEEESFYSSEGFSSLHVTDGKSAWATLVSE